MVSRSVSVRCSFFVGLFCILLQIGSIHGQNFSNLTPTVSQAVAADLIGNYTETLDFLHTVLPGYEPPAKAFWTTPQILKYDGYPSEVHTFTTEDGYVLTYHRIPYGKNSQGGNRPPVLVQHGLFSESTHWLYSNEANNLPYILANAGYDVWLGNCRGNRYCQTNVNYDSSDPRFWNFGWNEMGLYDLPAAIDYILKETAQSSLFYIGHSMGTTQFFVMASQLPQYNAKIRLMVAYAPVAYDSNMASPVKVLAPILGSATLGTILNTVPGPLTPTMLFQLVSGFATPACDQKDAIGFQACFSAFCAIIGCDQSQFNQTLLPVYVSTFPSSSAAIPVYHYMQEINCGASTPCFQTYQGKLLAPSPTAYDLTKITTSVSLVSGLADKLADPTDVLNLSKKLPNLVQNLVVNYANWSHFDFILGINASTLVYAPTLSLMQGY